MGRLQVKHACADLVQSQNTAAVSRAAAEGFGGKLAVAGRDRAQRLEPAEGVCKEAPNAVALLIVANGTFPFTACEIAGVALYRVATRAKAIGAVGLLI